MTQSADLETKNVVMHNNLVRHVTSGLAKLGAMEHKIIAAAVSQIDHTSDEIPDIDLNISDLVAGLKHGDIYRSAHAAAKNLVGEVLEFVDPNDNSTVICGWMSSARYRHGKGVITCKFSPDLLPVLVQLKELRTEMSLKSIMQIGGSAYAHRLYQLACSWRSNHGWTSRIDVLRDQLGVDEGAYSRAIDFRRYALKAPIKIINEKTDLLISFEKGNTGRTWTHIKFKILTQKPSKKMKKAEKLKREDSWWDDACLSEAGQDLIWAAANRLGLVFSDERNGMQLSSAHGLYEHREALFNEASQARLF